MAFRSLHVSHHCPWSAVCWVCGAHTLLMCFSKNCRRNMDRRTRWWWVPTVSSSSTSTHMPKKSCRRRERYLQEGPEQWVHLFIVSDYIFLAAVVSSVFSYSIPILCVMKVTTDVLTRDGKDIAFGDYSPTWRFHRKIVHGALCMFGEGSVSIEKIGEYSSLYTPSISFL